MEIIKLLLTKFDVFLKRAVLPSVSIVFVSIVIYTLFDDYITNTEFIDFVDKKVLVTKLGQNGWIVLGVILIGLSYFLSIVHQLVFDNIIKKNYNGNLFRQDNKQLVELRKLVIAKEKEKIAFSEEENYTDFFLYQIISRRLKYFKKQTDTTRYVDETKSIGIFAITIILINFILLYLTLGNCYITKGILLFNILLYFITFEAILSKYRSRAIRIYTNYLIGEKSTPKPPSKNENTISLKLEK